LLKHLRTQMQVGLGAEVRGSVCAALLRESFGLRWKRAWGPSALACSPGGLRTGRMSSPLGDLLCWRQPVLAPEGMVVSSDSGSGGTCAL